ncbi:MAG TPA: hypothetical protein VD886_22875 [Herpetosiphonaceae bacterium]|nr:hypothetical protein [Herpetosiphonaceae bacterium]
MGLFANGVRLAAAAAVGLAALLPGESRAVWADRPAAQPALALSARQHDLAAAVPEPTLAYPAGGEAIVAGETVTITWQTNGAPPDASYALEYTADCTITPTFTDTVENGANGWTVRHEGGLADWTRVVTKSHSPATSWFASNEFSLSNQFLTSPDLAIGAGDRLFFAHQYNLEAGYDGGVVELSDDGVVWFDLGLDMVANGYNMIIDPQATTLLAGAPAFSGASGGWLTTEVDLSAYAGKTVKIRFFQADDVGDAVEGWWVDDIEIKKVRAWVPIATSAPGATAFLWTTPAEFGADYCIRIRGQAPDHSPSAYATGAPFSLVGPQGTRAWLPVIIR